MMVTENIVIVATCLIKSTLLIKLIVVTVMVTVVMVTLQSIAGSLLVMVIFCDRL